MRQLKAKGTSSRRDNDRCSSNSVTQRLRIEYGELSGSLVRYQVEDYPTYYIEFKVNLRSLHKGLLGGLIEYIEHMRYKLAALEAMSELRGIVGGTIKVVARGVAEFYILTVVFNELLKYFDGTSLVACLLCSAAKVRRAAHSEISRRRRELLK